VNPLGKLTIAARWWLEFTGEEWQGAPVEAITADIEVRGNLAAWCDVLGMSSLSDVIKAANNCEHPVFADELAAAILGCFGLTHHRLSMRHEFYEQGYEPEERASFLSA
jgi:hypothetical protein